MKTKTKIIIVSSADWEKTVEIDCDVFDDIYLEACTQILDRNLKENNPLVNGFMYARSEHGKVQHVFNTYKILINAGYHKFAENLRINFKRANHVDLRKEPIRSQ